MMYFRQERTPMCVYRFECRFVVGTSVKTTGECARKIQAVEAGMGLDAYIQISDLYNAVSAAMVHDMRLRIMHPAAAAQDEEVAAQLEEWRANYMRLQLMDTMFDEFPGAFLFSSIRSILVGRINEHVDLECSKKEEPTLTYLLTVVRK